MLKKNFADFELSHEMSKAIAEMGFEEATPIQSLAIGPILAGADIIGQAQTGTGKTAAFGIPIVERIEPGRKKVQALILCPTRELAVQIAEELKLLGKHKKDIRILPVYGGQPIERQIAALQRGVQVVVGTPGRVRDHMERKTLHLDQVRVAVLDEADEMLDMGFVDEMKFILGAIEAPHQTLLFSATMPKAIMSLSKAFPERARTDPRGARGPDRPRRRADLFRGQGIPEDRDPGAADRYPRPEAGAGLLQHQDPRRRAGRAAAGARLRGQRPARRHEADAPRPGDERGSAAAAWKSWWPPTWPPAASTSTTSRWWSTTTCPATRNITCTASGARPGPARAAAPSPSSAGREMAKLAEIQRFAKTRIRRQRVPSLDDVEEIRNSAVLEKVRQIMETESAGRYAALVEKLTGDDHSSLDVAAALLKMVMEKDGKAATVSARETGFHSGTADSGPQAFKASKHRELRVAGEAAPRIVPGETTRLLIKLGKKQGIRPGDIVGAITGETDLTGRQIGAIEIHDGFSLVDVPQALAPALIEVMSRCQIKGHPVFIKPAKDKDDKK